jgi:hypothetical protein
MTQNITHTKHFTVDPHIIIELIFQQAGSTVKALSELVMNEIDAKAKDIHIHVDANMRNITVRGDGMGFTSLDDIEKLFGCFGFNHHTAEEKERNRDFGRFGLGRGQIFAFGKTLWKTNEFSMEVDLQAFQDNKSGGELPYRVTQHKTNQYRGCSVEIELYKPLSVFDRNKLETELKSMMPYVQPNIYVNDHLVNTPMDDVKWTAQTETLAFKTSGASSQRGLLIYNKGVFVREYSHSEFGISGVITSTTKAFDVNMARNDIQQATCELWASIKPLIKPYREKQQSKKTLTDQDRLFIFMQILAGEAEYDTFKSKKLFRAASGAYMTFNQLFQHSKTLTMPDSMPSRKGEALHHQGLATVLSCTFVGDIGYASLTNFIHALSQALEETSVVDGYGRWQYHELARNLKTLNIIPFEQASNSLDEHYEVIADSDLTPLDKIKLKALESLNGVASRLTQQPLRKLKIGRSETADAWTDGLGYVVLCKEWVDKSFENGMTSIGKLLPLLIHEYCHDMASKGDHNHDADFDFRFREAVERMMFTCELNMRSVEAYRLYFAGRRKAKMSIPPQELHRVFRDFPSQMMESAYGQSDLKQIV